MNYLMCIVYAFGNCVTLTLYGGPAAAMRQCHLNISIYNNNNTNNWLSHCTQTSILLLIFWYQNYVFLNADQEKVNH